MDSEKTYFHEYNIVYTPMGIMRDSLVARILAALAMWGCENPEQTKIYYTVDELSGAVTLRAIATKDYQDPKVKIL